MKYYAGLDLGGTFVKGGIVDEEGNILVKDKIPTGKERPYEEIAKDMAELAAELAKRANVPAGALAAAGIGSPCTRRRISSEKSVRVTAARRERHLACNGSDRS